MQTRAMIKQIDYLISYKIRILHNCGFDVGKSVCPSKAGMAKLHSEQDRGSLAHGGRRAIMIAQS